MVPRNHIGGCGAANRVVGGVVDEDAPLIRTGELARDIGANPIVFDLIEGGAGTDNRYPVPTVPDRIARNQIVLRGPCSPVEQDTGVVIGVVAQRSDAKEVVFDEVIGTLDGQYTLDR